MTLTRITLSALLVAPLLVGGCAVRTTHIRQKDGTVRTTRCLVCTLSSEQYRSSTSDEDHMVAWKIHDVEYAWPKGKATLKSADELHFQGEAIRGKVLKRELFVNDRSMGTFESGDNVRITGDGHVFVNDQERRPPDDKPPAVKQG